MQPSEVVNIVYYAVLYIAAVIFIFAGFRAFTISRALVNRVYRNQAYFTGALAIFVGVSTLVGHLGNAYGFLLIIVFVLVDTAILVALETDFFHRNTLRWKQVRLVAYGLLVAAFVLSTINGGFSPVVPALISLPAAVPLIVACIIFIFAYTTATAIVSARRTPDKPLKRFMVLAGLFLFGLLINSLVFTFVTVVFSSFFFLAFSYIVYRMAMSLSPVGKVEKEIKG